MRESTDVTGLVSKRGVAVAALVAMIGLEGVAYAGPDDREQCAASAEQAQQLRDEGKYRRAREQMLLCARDICPGPIKSDCGKWLTELDRDAPTVVFGARDVRGSDVFDVKVSIDGSPIQERLDGKPVLVDSGEHTFKFEAKDGTVKEEKVLLRAAEKARPIIVTLGGNGGASSGGVGAGGAAGGDTKQEGSIVPAIVVGGIGVIALGSFAIFGIGGKNDVDDLQKCKPYCKEADVDSARTKLIIADISLGVGVVALGVATYMFLTRPKVDAKVQTGASTLFRTVRLDGGPTASGGGYASIGAKF
jgi:hypothetical protein